MVFLKKKNSPKLFNNFNINFLLEKNIKLFLVF